MTVVDASVAIDLLLGTPRSHAAQALAERIADRDALAAPELLDVEVAQVMRRFVLRGRMSVAQARTALEDLDDLPVARYPLRGLVGRAFAWHANVTLYDGVYLALAEALDRPLLTGDGRLADVPGCTATVTVVETGT